MRVSVMSELADVEIVSASFGELSLMAHTIDSMFETMRKFEREKKTTITDISIQTEHAPPGMRITIRGRARDMENE